MSPAPQGPQENTSKAEFMATPNSFSDDGDHGEVYGVLQELSSSRELLHETSLEDSGFTLHFERYSFKIEPCTYGPNKFFIRGGTNVKTFKIGAEVISDRGKCCRQAILIMRGEWRFSFKVEPSQFTLGGGAGKVVGTTYITDFDGNVIREGNLYDSNFGLNVSGNPKGITADFDVRIFTVAAGDPATFELQAYTGYGQPYLIEIKREG